MQQLYSSVRKNDNNINIVYLYFDIFGPVSTCSSEIDQV